jgi:hypothetical protein
MKLNKEFIEYFNKNKSKDKYREIFNEYFSNGDKCRICGDVVYYYDSTFLIGSKDKEIKLKNKSYLTTKYIDREYRLSICEDCLSKKYPEYQNKNKSRVFNQMNYITEYAFDIPRYVSVSWMKEKYAITEENLIKKHGVKIGSEKWISYCNKQSLTNTFDYKSNRYGWSREDFDNYNKSRSITLDTMVNKYGENIGLIKWNDYIEKQKTTKSKDYVVKNYGEEFWKNQCKSKGHTLESYLKRYKSETIANEKLIEFYSKLNSPSVVSKSSQAYFNKIDDIIGSKYKTYFYSKDGKEYGKNLGNRWVYLDYFISDINLNIEYNGDLFHGNPDIFGPEDEPIPFNSVKAKDIWERDAEKIKLLEDKFNIRTIVIWESNLPSIENLIKIIENG